MLSLWGEILASLKPTDVRFPGGRVPNERLLLVPLMAFRALDDNHIALQLISPDRGI
jgi:hypothetical protein